MNNQSMDKLKNIEDLEIYLKSKNYTEEEIINFTSTIKPFYEFYNFMLETHKMDYDMVEKDTSEFSQTIFTDYLKEMETKENKMKYMMEISGDIMKRYANKYDYPCSENVKIAMNKYSELLFLSNINNDGTPKNNNEKSL